MQGLPRTIGQGQVVQKASPGLAEQVAEVVEDAVAVQDGLGTVLYGRSQRGECHAIAGSFPSLADIRRREVTLRQNAAQLKLAEPIAVATVGFGLVLGQGADYWWMAQVDRMAQFFQQIGHPRPAEGGLQGHGHFRVQVRQPGAHGVFVVVFQPRPFHRADLAIRRLFHYTYLTELAMVIPSQCTGIHGCLLGSRLRVVNNHPV